MTHGYDKYICFMWLYANTQGNAQFMECFCTHAKKASAHVFVARSTIAQFPFFKVLVKAPCASKFVQPRLPPDKRTSRNTYIVISTLIATFNHRGQTYENTELRLPLLHCHTLDLHMSTIANWLYSIQAQTQMILIRIPLPLYLIFFFGLSCTKKMRAINTTPALAFYRISCILQR